MRQRRCWWTYLAWLAFVGTAPACSRSAPTAEATATVDPGVSDEASDPEDEAEVAVDPEPDAAAEVDDDDCPKVTDAFAVETLKARIGHLASDTLAGRLSGSAGDKAARAFIAKAYSCAGLTAIGAFEHPFTDSSGNATANVIGVLHGSDPEVGGEIILVSAHFDHLGVDQGGAAFAGANDNASGISALLAIADSFAATGYKPKRTIVFAAFGAEELELDGSKAYAKQPPPGLSVAKTMYIVNMDMVGRYDDSNVLFGLDAAKGTPARSAIDAVRGGFPDLKVNLDEPGDSSDHISLCAVGVPGVFFHTPDAACYHKTCDRAEKIDYPHLSQAAALIAATVRQLSDAEHGLAEARASGCKL